MPRGCIYVARNDEINPPNLYKIGKTEFAEPNRRMKELTNETTNWNGKYEAKAWVFVEDVDRCEKIIHRELSSCRVRRNREFFIIEFNDILHAIRVTLNDYIIPGHGHLENFDIHEISKKTFKSFLTNETTSIFKLFEYANKNSMCTNLYCWEDRYAFQSSLSVIVSNSLKKKINLDKFNSPDELKNLLYKEIYLKEFCKQLTELTENHFYLFNNEIDEEREQHQHILTRKSLKPIIIKNIFHILNEARSNRRLKKIINDKILNSFFYHAYSMYLKKNLINSRKRRKEIEENEREKIIQKELKIKEKKIKIKKQKINQSKRGKERFNYLKDLKKLPLLLRLKQIISKQPFGLNGIDDDLFEADNENEFMYTFVMLEINEQKEFKKLIKRNKKKIFKKLNKMLKNN